MAQQFIVLNMLGEDALTVLNSNFTELYASIVAPWKLPGVSANTMQAVASDTMVTNISISGTAGAPVMRIGITPNGTEIMPDVSIGNSQLITADEYFQGAGNLYFTVSGGTVNIRIEYEPKYYN